jgi:hypothetical protein
LKEVIFTNLLFVREVLSIEREYCKMKRYQKHEKLEALKVYNESDVFSLRYSEETNNNNNNNQSHELVIYQI